MLTTNAPYMARAITPKPRAAHMLHRARATRLYPSVHVTGLLGDARHMNFHIYGNQGIQKTPL